MSNNREEVYQGLPASPGIIIGSTMSLSRDTDHVCAEKVADVELELEMFRKAVEHVKKALQRTAESVRERLGPEFGRIFEAQALIVGDKVWNENVERRIKKEKVCAEFIYDDESKKVIRRLAASGDSYLRERIQDIEAVTARVVGRMKGEKKFTLKGMGGATVVVARYLSPAEIMALSVKRNFGFASGVGGSTSHTALMAKSLSIPGVIGLGKVAENIPSGKKVIIDGYRGKFIVEPSPATVRRYRAIKRAETQLKRQLAQLRSKLAVTKDGFRVDIMANIELPSEVGRAISAGAAGIGLYRTEYLFLTRGGFPAFEEQYKAYSSIVRRMGGRPVVIRTFDLGGDKFPGASDKSFELNPFLGWRAIRVCLDRPELFKTQLKALLKASRWGSLSIMIPMVSNFEELTAVRSILAECKQELRKGRIKFKEPIPLGVMLEVPSAVMIADALAKEVDFFSIGTNDLIQYTLAVDRGNEMLSKLYQSYHPSVLSLIKSAVSAGHGCRLKVSVCGEMAADPLGAVLLVGLGVDELSANFQNVGILKKVVRSITYADAKQMAEEALKMKTSAEIEDYLFHEIQRLFPDLKAVMEFSGRNANARHSSA